MAWIAPKIDWDSADYYNFADLNRVENNTDFLATLLGTYGTTPTLIGVTTSRDNTNIEFYDDLNRIENNILIIKNYSGTPIIWITPKTTWVTLDSFGYTDANRLEQNISELYNVINNIILELEHCGSFTCGQDFNLGGY